MNSFTSKIFNAVNYPKLGKNIFLKVFSSSSMIMIYFMISSCSTTKQIDLYNPYPDKDIMLERKNVECADSYQKKLWYVLYGNYPINHINARELFPSSEYTYKVEQVATVGDKILSFVTGLFFSISRKTLIVKTCQVAAKLKKNDQKEDIPDKYNSKIEKLENEISFLKGKISGIETTVGWMNSPALPQQDISPMNQKTGIRSLKDNDETMAKILEMKPQEVNHSHFFFKRGSSTITFENRNKLRSLKEIFNKPLAKILIIGSADSVGDFKSNLSLSWKRANAVKNALIKFGIDPKKIQISGAGENNPKKSLAILENSRRVDIYLVQGGEK